MRYCGAGFGVEILDERFSGCDGTVCDEDVPAFGDQAFRKGAAYATCTSYVRLVCMGLELAVGEWYQ